MIAYVVPPYACMPVVWYSYVYELCYGDMRHSVQRVMKYTDAFKHDMMLHLLKGATLMHQLGLVHRDMKADVRDGTR